MIRQCRAHAGGEPGIEVAGRLGVHHRTVTYRPAAFLADECMPVDTVCRTAYDAINTKGNP